MIRPVSIPLPQTPFARFRLLFLGFAVAGALLAAVAIPGGEASPVSKLAGIVLAVALAVYWIVGYRRGTFSLALEPVEAYAVFVVLHAAPGDPFLPLLGVLFRSLYGGFARAVARWALWMAALLAAHAGRGHEQFEADLARVAAVALAPVLAQALLVALKTSETIQRRLNSIVQNSTDVVTIVGADHRVRWQAESIRGVLGHAPDAIVGTRVHELVHPEDRSALDAYFTDAEGKPEHRRSLTLRLAHGAGGHRHFDVVAANRLHDPSVEGFVLNMRDATDRRELEDELRALAAQREHDALHDPLTGLANRRKLFARLEDTTTAARAAKTKLALLLIDLDHFKELNDTLGHHAGDRLLREIGPRLEACAPEAELVARVGGDEFAVLMPLDTAVEAAEVMATKLGAAIEEPFRFQGMTMLVRASVGIAMFPEHGRDVESLMQRADIAMYSAKSRGVGYEVYSASRDGHSRARLALIGELPEAIESGQIVVHYQPKFDLQTGVIRGAEALVRWEHPQFGLLGPGAFLPLAEQTGLMRPLTLRVLDDALAQCSRWLAAGLSLPVAVNLGAPNLLDLGLPVDVKALLEKWELDPSMLQLEITETIVAADPVRVIEIMNKLGELGIELSLDDFGTGSSSLAYLRELPVQELKIDKSFVLGMDEDPEAATIVQTIVDLAHNLGLRAVGEGIETDEAYRLLAESGCDFGQGFLMGRPMPAGELAELALKTPVK
ncbi:EAL domain-containing protein [Solirubrobacter sp. CPCC 204708]|uniref:EAL domain-containing protein n=1 Tax=Solirubrobacter deserti TaxID=2282478 RepID=A0ABT4RP15_9ACTN|nr:EAL domain-containing protein [Solirubrobacter deserti]MBE2317530.1 EAL domain-containing protein [Solirubrobacter deserti]MDA0140294.1 EAL domain-containing protein [Solirubrobacter deserti]